MPVSATKPQLKILIAVWGEHHIRRLDALGIASILAPGNLPAIAQAHSVELVILTCASDQAVFEALPSMEQVRRHARVRYLPIDDLIVPGQYSTTLHLAFMRGIAQFGEQMTSMHFLFWNADFVLSDGALLHIADLIRKDTKVVITGTLRCVAEQSVQLLLRMRDRRTGVLTAAARQLVEVAFRYPHPHHVAKTVNQSLCWSSMPSQMLWRIDAHTQLGRFFKAFMFCLKPTRVMTAINGPCDYALVPELCPGEPQHMIQNSDDAFILEVQDRDAEREFISSGLPKEAERQACMGEWLTAEHLDTGRRTVIFRSGAGAPSATMAKAQDDFEAYFRAFMSGVAPPNSHKGQYYWLFGVATWNRLREHHAPGQLLPQELAMPLPLEDLRSGTNDRHRTRIRTLRSATSIPADTRRLLFGDPLKPAALHPDAPSTALLDAVASELRGALPADGRLLVVSETGEWLDEQFPDSDPRVYRLEPIPAEFWPLGGTTKADALLIYVKAPQTFDAPSLMQRAAGVLSDGALVSVLWHDPAFKAEPSWIETQIKQSLSAFGLLDDLAFRRHEATVRDRRYAASFYRTLERRRHGLLSSGLFHARLGAAFAARLSGLGSREPSGRTLLAHLTGRYHAARFLESAAPRQPDPLAAQPYRRDRVSASKPTGSRGS